MNATKRATSLSRRTGPMAAAAVLVAGALAGCAQVAAAPAAPSPATASPASAISTRPTPAAEPLSCDDLIPKAQIVQALAAGQPSDDWVVLPVSAAAGSVTGAKAVEGAGGLSCSWKAGPPNSEAGVAALTVAILPDAADDWTGQMYGDGPTSDRRTFAGVSAAATCGDPGCGASAAVGSSWVRIDLTTGSREGGESAFAKETDDQVFADLTPAVETVFQAVQGASAEQLRFPDHIPADGTPADCRTYLTKADIAGALDVKDVRVTTNYQLTPALYSIAGAAAQRLGTSVCTIEDPRYSYPTELASITVAPEQSWAVDDLASNPAERGDLRVIELEGAVEGEHALSDCGSSANVCSVVFSLASTAIQVENTPHAVSVAEAIIAGRGEFLLCGSTASSGPQPTCDQPG